VGKFITVGLILGTTLGGLIPSLWGADYFSVSGIIFSTLGGAAGIWVGYKMGQ
jgi:hypothetical protein